MGRPAALLVIAAGVLLVLIGVLGYFGAWSWFGRLPGDLRIEGERTRIYIPLASMLLLSVFLSLLLYFLRRLW